MIINQFAGSGGDALPWYFRKAGPRPAGRHRTWGGLVGIGGYPELIDGGRVTAPRARDLWSEWRMGSGEPWHRARFEVDLDPAAYRQGRDSQLDKAIDSCDPATERTPVAAVQAPGLSELSRA